MQLYHVKIKGTFVLCFVYNPAGQAIHKSWTDRASLYWKVLDIHGDSLRGKHLTIMFYTLDIGHLHIEIHTVLLQITFIHILIRTLMYIFKLCINVLLPTNFSSG